MISQTGKNTATGLELPQGFDAGENLCATRSYKIARESDDVRPETIDRFHIGQKLLFGHERTYVNVGELSDGQLGKGRRESFHRETKFLYIEATGAQNHSVAGDGKGSGRGYSHPSFEKGAPRGIHRSPGAGWGAK
jgi:hypothetical protein